MTKNVWREQESNQGPQGPEPTNLAIRPLPQDFSLLHYSQLKSSDYMDKRVIFHPGIAIFSKRGDAVELIVQALHDHTYLSNISGLLEELSLV